MTYVLFSDPAVAVLIFTLLFLIAGTLGVAIMEDADARA